MKTCLVVAWTQTTTHFISKARHRTSTVTVFGYSIGYSSSTLADESKSVLMVVQFLSKLPKSRPEIQQSSYQSPLNTSKKPWLPGKSFLDLLPKPNLLHQNKCLHHLLIARFLLGACTTGSSIARGLGIG